MTQHMSHNSLQLISQIGRDLISLADLSEGMENWEKRHIHVRLFASEIYGDSDEADIFQASMSLCQGRLSDHK